MQRLLTTHTDNPDLAVRGRLLKGAALVLMVSLLLFLPLLALRTGPPPTPYLIERLVIVALCSGVVFVLAHTGAIQIGGLLLCVVLVSSNVVGALTSATGLPLLAFLNTTHVIVILTAGMVIGAWATLLFGSMSFVAMLLVLAVPSWGTDGAFGTGFLNVICACLLWLTIRTLEHSLGLARQQTTVARQAEHDLAAQQETLLATNHELTEVNERTAKLLEVIRDLETPLIPLFQGVLILPLVGHLDGQRTSQITQTTLTAVYQQRAHTVIIDLTGAAVLDTMVLHWLGELGEAIRLLGARSLLTGMRAEVALAMVIQGVEIPDVQTFGRLQDGIGAVLETLDAAEAR